MPRCELHLQQPSCFPREREVETSNTTVYASPDLKPHFTLIAAEKGEVILARPVYGLNPLKQYRPSLYLNTFTPESTGSGWTASIRAVPGDFAEEVAPALDSEGNPLGSYLIQGNATTPLTVGWTKYPATPVGITPSADGSITILVTASNLGGATLGMDWLEVEEVTP